MSRSISHEMDLFMVSKRTPRFAGRCCENPDPVTLRRVAGGGAYKHPALTQHRYGDKVGPCTRPAREMATIDGEDRMLCSLCWLNWVAFHGVYRLVGLNSAAAMLSSSPEVLERLHIESRGGDLAPVSDLEELFALSPWEKSS